MIYIDRERVPIPDFFRDGENPYEEEILYRLESQSKYKQSRFKRDDQFLDKVFNNLIDLFHNKCAYCESTIEKQSINHFRPSDSVSGREGQADEGYYWLSYTWFNLYLSCYECQRYKSNYFPVIGQRLKPPLPKVYLSYRDLQQYVKKEETLILDPCDKSVHERNQFYYDNSGRVVPQSEQADYTIELLKLNRPRLVQERHETILFLSEIMTSVNFNSDASHVLDEILYHIQDHNMHLGLIRQIISEWFLANEKLIDNQYPKHYKKFMFALSKIVPSWRDLGQCEAMSTFEPVTFLKEKEEPYEGSKFSKFIEWVEITNFKSIQHIKLQIPQNSDGQGEQSILLIGENGVGKSTVLQAIALAMMGDKELKMLNIGPYEELIRRNAKMKLATIKVKFINEPDLVIVNIKPDKIKSNREHLVKPTVGIGSVRRLPEDGEKVTFEDDLSRILGLFRHDVVFPDVQPWLTDTKEVDADQFNEAAKTIIDMLMIPEELVTDGRMVNRKQGKVTVNVGNGPESIKNMSDGYRSVIGYALYIMRSLSIHWESAYNAEGLIIIDEIGNHLHPTWKIKVVSLLRQVFPRCTFIISTHDPLCLRSSREGEVWVMSLNEETRRVQLEQKDIPMGISLENLLIGDWFYMDHTTDERTSKLVEDHSIEMFKKNPDQEKIKTIEAQLERTVMQSSSGISKLDTVLNFVKDEQNKSTIDLSKDTELRAKLAQRIRDQIKS